MSDGMTEAFRTKKSKEKEVRKEINKHVTLVINKTANVVFIENTVGGPQLTDQIYLKVDTFEQIVKEVKKALKNGSK
jgi:hypothetical protein